MAIREEYERSGGRLFKWRIFLWLLFVPVLAVAMTESQMLEKFAGRKFEICWEIASICIAFFGLLIRCITVGNAPKGTSGRNINIHKANTLNTTGMYSIVRHPLYVGDFFIFLGIALFIKVWWLVLLGLVLFWLYYERIIFSEEAYLRGKFGDVFMKWAESTPVIIPDLSKWRSPELSFSIKSVLKREYNGFFAIVATTTALHVLETMVTEKKLYISDKWLAFFLTGLAVYIGLWALRKFTGLLRVEGR